MQVISSLGFPQAVGSATMWILFLSFLSLAFSPGFGFLKFGFWMLDFCESWILEVESWILDLGF